MALAPGDPIGDRHRLIEPFPEGTEPGDADAWLARTGDGELAVLRRGRAPAWPAGLFHPSLIPSETLPDGWFARRHVDAPSAAAIEPLPVRTVFAAGARLAEALGVLHGASLAHGNVHAGTILVPDPRRPVLVDPTTEGTPREDLRALLDVLAGWLGSDASAADRRLLERARDEGWPADELRERLEDARLAGHATPMPDARADARPEPEPGGAPATSPVDSRTLRLRWIGAAVAAAVAAVSLTWLLLPDPQPPETAPRPAPVAVEPVPEPTVAPPSEAELAALLERRRAAEATLDAFIQLQLRQEERAVERWGAEAFATALALAKEAETPFREQDYARAETLYGEALAAMEAVAALGDRTLSEALERGQAALADGVSATARDSFELALALEPALPEAEAGLARARTLDEALALAQRASAAEEQGRFEEALTSYEELLVLDPAMPGVAEAPARIRRAMRDRSFRQAMSDGLAALELQDWAGARERFEAARRIRPDDPAPARFIAEAEQRSREFILASHRRKAAEALDAENWQAAIGHYEAMLKREPNARVAREGLDLARERAELAGALERLVAQPQSWWSERGRAQVRALIDRARAVDGDLPRLRAQRQRLETLLARAEEPVAVTLRSDNACNVVVYKVARLGTFGERTLTLKPGRYTAVGTRSGYRDVRKEFLVPAGRTPEPVSLMCEEPV